MSEYNKIEKLEIKVCNSSIDGIQFDYSIENLIQIIEFNEKNLNIFKQIKNDYLNNFKKYDKTYDNNESNESNVNKKIKINNFEDLSESSTKISINKSSSSESSIKNIVLSSIFEPSERDFRITRCTFGSSISIKEDVKYKRIQYLKTKISKKSVDGIDYDYSIDNLIEMINYYQENINKFQEIKRKYIEHLKSKI